MTISIFCMLEMGLIPVIIVTDGHPDVNDFWYALEKRIILE